MAKSKPTHYATAHAVGPFARGQVVTAEDLDASIGVKEGTSAEDAAKVREAAVARLVDLGAIAEVPAPPDPEAAAETADAKSTERLIAEEEAAARKARAEAEKSAPPPPKK